MKSKVYIAAILSMLPLISVAQHGFDSILREVEQNNTELAAYRQQTDAQKLENKTGIYLQNPEVDGAYLWGTPSAIGNRQDFSVMQPFDFPSAYKHRSKLADTRNVQADYAYAEKRMLVLLQAKQLCINLVYLNKRCAELQQRLVNAESLSKAYSAAFDKGEVNILDRNKANLSLLNAQQDVKLAEADRRGVLQQLATLNGGKPVEFSEQRYPQAEIPENFDEWFATVEANNPSLQLASGDVEATKQQVSLSKSLTLPKFSAGYMLENVVGERYQGVKVALTVPLWENKNTVKQAKAQNLAAQSSYTSVKQSAKGYLKSLYDKAKALQEANSGYQQNLQLLSNADLLKKALDKGHLNLVEYVMELQLYYDAIDRMLDEEQNLYLALVELKAWEL